MIHELKTLPNYFAEVISGKKTFEVRKFDRPFHVGDLLALNEFNPTQNCYTGNSCLVYIDYILTDSEFCKKDYCVMSIKPCWIRKAQQPFDGVKFAENYSVPYATKEGDNNEN